MLTRIHVNQHNIKKNKKNKTNLPVITVKDYKRNRKGFSVKIDGPCEIVYRPNSPLACGATVWIETKEKVEVI